MVLQMIMRLMLLIRKQLLKLKTIINCNYDLKSGTDDDYQAGDVLIMNLFLRIDHVMMILRDVGDALYADLTIIC